MQHLPWLCSMRKPSHSSFSTLSSRTDSSYFPPLSYDYPLLLNFIHQYKIIWTKCDMVDFTLVHFRKTACCVVCYSFLYVSGKIIHLANIILVFFRAIFLGHIINYEPTLCIIVRTFQKTHFVFVREISINGCTESIRKTGEFLPLAAT